VEGKPRILAVDDIRTNLLIIRAALGDSFECAVATSGEQALEQASSFRPDVVLLDIVMPGIDGYETCRRIRQNPLLLHAKIIMVSSRSSLKERLQAYAAGADDYLIKPFEAEELLAKIGVFLRLKSTEEFDRFRTDVITLLSHEMRTPLTTMLGPAQMLMGEDIDSVQRKELAGLIYAGAHRLRRLIEKAQLLGSLWSGSWKPSLQTVSMTSALRPLLDRAAKQCAARGITLVEDLQPCPEVHTDARGIDQVIGSILDNAVRFSLDGRQIRVTLRTEGNELRVSVVDQGPGIRPEFLPRVFEAFARDDIHHHTEGQSLSMVIARQIMSRLGGAITVESTFGAGTTFMVSLPLQTRAEAA
jgi:two-component system, sensor histidine kinase and response regulator